jgi:hypothetical protein
VKKNPRPSASRGFLSKLDLASTSANGGVANDDNQQDYLSNTHYHGVKSNGTPAAGQVPNLSFIGLKFPFHSRCNFSRLSNRRFFCKFCGCEIIAAWVSSYIVPVRFPF